VVADPGDRRDDIAPARVLHEYFETLETPYRVFDAEDPNALAQAIAQVNELQSLPIRYIDVVPRKKIAKRFYVAAMILVTMLLVIERAEVRRW
jgi:mxaC protein